MKILLLEDDMTLNEIISEYLISQGHEVYSAFDGEEAEFLIYDNIFDLLLLDVNVPSLNGFDLLTSLRKNNINIPSIFITSRNTIEDVKIGFKVGCDEYLKKPFDLEELGLRIENLFKMLKLDYSLIQIDFDKTYNPKTKLIIASNNEFQLSKTEAKVFEYLLKNRNRVVSIDEISINNWVYDEMPTATTIRTYIKKLRKVLGRDVISNIKNVGYILKVES